MTINTRLSAGLVSVVNALPLHFSVSSHDAGNESNEVWKVWVSLWGPTFVWRWSCSYTLWHCLLSTESPVWSTPDEQKIWHSSAEAQVWLASKGLIEPLMLVNKARLSVLWPASKLLCNAVGFFLLFSVMRAWIWPMVPCVGCWAATCRHSGNASRWRPWCTWHCHAGETWCSPTCAVCTWG